MRNTYAHQIETLLGEIDGHVHELRRLKTFGVGTRALAERKHELARIRRQLAELVARRRAAPPTSEWQLAPNS